MDSKDLYVVRQVIAEEGGGGSGFPASLDADTTVDLNGKFLKFEDANAEVLFDSPNYTLSLEVINDTDKESEIAVGGDGTTPRIDLYIKDFSLVNNEAEINLGWDDGTTPKVNITAGDGTNNSGIKVTPLSINVTGKIENLDSLSFKDNTNFIRMYSPDGSPWLITVDDAGVLQVNADV